MSADSNCHKVLMRALDYDEAGDKVGKFKKVKNFYRMSTNNFNFRKMPSNFTQKLWR